LFLPFLSLSFSLHWGKRGEAQAPSLANLQHVVEGVAEGAVELLAVPTHLVAAVLLTVVKSLSKARNKGWLVRGRRINW